ncbi:hypothetical protein ACNKHR_14180 [Shigella flexneri]
MSYWAENASRECAHQYPDPVVAYPAGQRAAYLALSDYRKPRCVGFRRDARLFLAV